MADLPAASWEGLQAERTGLAWVRSTAAVAGLEAAGAVAVIHADSRAVYAAAAPLLIACSVLLLLAQRDLHRAPAPAYGQRWRTMQFLAAALTMIAGIGLVIALA